MAEDEWEKTRQRTVMFADLLGHTCLPQFRDLIVEEVRKLAARSSPETRQEVEAANAHDKLVKARIRSIAHASTSSASTPSASAACLEIVQDICSRPPDGANSLSESVEANSRIRTACWNTTFG